MYVEVTIEVNEDGKSAEETYYLYKESELKKYISNPEFYNFELVKKDKDTKGKMNGVTFTLKVYNEDDEKVDLINAETLEK